jgi:hypothetical protein
MTNASSLAVSFRKGLADAAQIFDAYTEARYRFYE